MSRKTLRKDLENHLLDTRFKDGEFVITADIPGTRKDDLRAGIDPDTNKLVIGKNEAVLARVPLPWDSVEPTRAVFHNDVLEIRVHSDDI